MALFFEIPQSDWRFEPAASITVPLSKFLINSEPNASELLENIVGDNRDKVWIIDKCVRNVSSNSP